jgi:hypothetical protein
MAAVGTVERCFSRTGAVGIDVSSDGALHGIVGS